MNQPLTPNTPSAEALRWFENTFSHVVIRDDERLFYDAVVAALTAPIEKIEDAEAIDRKYLDEAMTAMKRIETALYAQGRTQSSVPDDSRMEVLAGLERLCSYEVWHKAEDLEEQIFWWFKASAPVLKSALSAALADRPAAMSGDFTAFMNAYSLLKHAAEHQVAVPWGLIMPQLEQHSRALTAPVVTQTDLDAIEKALDNHFEDYRTRIDKAAQGLDEFERIASDARSYAGSFLNHESYKQREADIVAVRNALTANVEDTGGEDFQSRVKPWMAACFGPEISADKIERNHRFLEEALELVQSCGCTQSEAHQLVDYVFGRDVGEINQEVGGVMVTLAALCLANGIDMHECGETELARIWTKVEKIRAKQAAKPKHGPLPQHVTPAIETAKVEGDLGLKNLDALIALHTAVDDRNSPNLVKRALCKEAFAAKDEYEALKRRLASGTPEREDLVERLEGLKREFPKEFSMDQGLEIATHNAAIDACIATIENHVVETDRLKDTLRDVLKAIVSDRHAVQDTIWVNGTPIGDFIMCALDEDIELDEMQNAPYRCKKTGDLLNVVIPAEEFAGIVSVMSKSRGYIDRTKGCAVRMPNDLLEQVDGSLTLARKYAAEV